MSINYSPKIVTDGMVFYLDAANPKSYNYSPNRFSNPTDIYAWYNQSVGNSCTVSKDISIVSPVGSSPLKMVVTGNDAHIGSYNNLPYNICPITTGETWTVSVYTKASQNTIGQIFIFGANSSGSVYISGNYPDITAKTINITTEWTRSNHEITFANTISKFIQLRLDGTETNGSGNTIWWDGLQVEKSATPTTFNQRTTPNTWINLSNTSNIGILVNKPQITYNNSKYISFSNTYSQYCDFPNYIRSNTFSNRSMSVWFRCTGINESLAVQGIVNVFDDAENNPQSSIAIDSAGSFISYTVFPESGSAGVSAPISQNTWYNLVGVENYDYGQKNIKIYLNGSYYNQLNFIANNYLIASSKIKIGCQKLGFNRYFNGDISNVIVYDKSLSETQIKQNFNAMRGRFGI